MNKRQLLLANSESSISVKSIETWARGWLLDCELRQLSNTTISNRKLIIEKFLWFMQDREFEYCGINEIKRFIAYISNGHEDERGRWGNDRFRSKVRPTTVATHYTNLRTMFRYFVEEG